MISFSKALKKDLEYKNNKTKKTVDIKKKSKNDKIPFRH